MPVDKLVELVDEMSVTSPEDALGKVPVDEEVERMIELAADVVTAVEPELG